MVLANVATVKDVNNANTTLRPRATLLPLAWGPQTGQALQLIAE